MKSYFLLFLLLMILCLPQATFSQEQYENESFQTTEQPQPSDLSHSEQEERHDWIDHPEDGAILEHLPHSMSHDGDSFQSKFFNMLFILGLLIGFMMLASWALKRMMKNKMTHLNTGSAIKVLETRYLSPRATLYLVEIHNQNFLIAESPTTVTYLAALPPEEEHQE